MPVYALPHAPRRTGGSLPRENSPTHARGTRIDASACRGMQHTWILPRSGEKIASSLFETLFKDFSDIVRYQNSFFLFSLKDDESGNLKLKRLFFFFSYNLNCNYVY